MNLCHLFHRASLSPGILDADTTIYVSTLPTRSLCPDCVKAHSKNWMPVFAILMSQSNRFLCIYKKNGDRKDLLFSIKKKSELCHTLPDFLSLFWQSNNTSKSRSNDRDKTVAIIELHAGQCSSTWVTFRVVEIEVILSERLQAALVVSKCMMATGPGWHDSVCSHMFV